MARLFDDALTQYLQVNQAIVTAVPFAMSCLCYTDVDNIVQVPMSIVNTGNNTNWWCIALQIDGTVDAVDCGNTPKSAESTGAITTNTWEPVCAVFASLSDRRIYLRGSKDSNADLQDPGQSGIDAVGIGRNSRKTAYGYFSGRIAAAAIWDLTNWPGATGSDKADNFEAIAVPALAKNYSPLFFMLGLKPYWPLIRDEDQDRVGGYHMTPYNSPTIADHPPMIYPASPVFYPKAAAAPAGNPWYAYAQQ